MNKTIQQVGEMVGIPAKETDKVLDEVKSNIAKLDGCDGPHDFSIAINRHTKKPLENQQPTHVFGAKWQCSKCGGYVDAINRTWYERGLKHGGYGWYCGKCERWLPETEKGYAHTDGVCYCSEKCAEEKDADRR